MLSVIMFSRKLSPWITQISTLLFFHLFFINYPSTFTPGACWKMCACVNAIVCMFLHVCIMGICVIPCHRPHGPALIRKMDMGFLTCAIKHAMHTSARQAHLSLTRVNSEGKSSTLPPKVRVEPVTWQSQKRRFSQLSYNSHNQDICLAVSTSIVSCSAK